MKNNTPKQKLVIHKETLRVLSSEQLSPVHGGYVDDFTYTLSTGDRCQKSNDMSGGGYTCRCIAE